MRCSICNAELEYDEDDLCTCCTTDILRSFEPQEGEAVDRFIKRIGRKDEA